MFIMIGAGSGHQKKRIWGSESVLSAEKLSHFT